MFRRRAKQAAEQAPETSGEPVTERAAELAGEQGDPASVAGKPPRANGPWDVSELDGSHPSHDRSRIDLGGMRIRPLPGMKMQMQVDSATGKATSVLLIGDQAAVQLMAIAAAKSTPLWPQTKGAVKADATRRGGKANEAPGPWGPVLQLSLPATTSDGSAGVQPSLVIGVDGPRWMLRATMIGKAAIDQQVHNQMLAIVQDTVVVRGEVPMAPGELLELRPPQRPEDQPEESGAEPEEQ